MTLTVHELGVHVADESYLVWGRSIAGVRAMLRRPPGRQRRNRAQSNPLHVPFRVHKEAAQVGADVGAIEHVT